MDSETAARLEFLREQSAMRRRACYSKPPQVSELEVFLGAIFEVCPNESLPLRQFLCMNRVQIYVLKTFWLEDVDLHETKSEPLRHSHINRA